MKKLFVTIFLVYFVIFSAFSQELQVKTIKAKEVSQETIQMQVSESHEGNSQVMASRSSGSSITGNTTGVLSVSLTGGANYNIPIVVPPGLNGVQPEISLSYNSQGGNGLAGWGWNVSGISMITRIPSTQFHDNIIDGVDFDANDRFAFDGQRLILKKGSYGGSGAEYQTEKYSNVKITSHGTHPMNGVNGPKYFTVRYPDGSFAQYGLNNDSRSRVDYAISYWENPQGVRINYTYSSDNNGLKVDKISYGTRENNTPVNTVEFKYGDRERKEQSFISGISFTRSKILTQIKVKGAGGVAYKNYVLTHNQTSLGYNRLIQVQEKTGDYGLSKKPIIFNYGSTPNSIIPTNRQPEDLSVVNIEQRNSRYISMDFTGNGKMDFAIYPTTGSEAKKKFWVFEDIQNSSYGNFGHEVSIGGKFEDIFPVTFLNFQNRLMPNKAIVVIQNISNNRTKFKIIGYGGAVQPVALKYEKTWDAPTYYTINQCAPASDPEGGTRTYRMPQKYVSGDFDGDGLTDVISIAKSYSVRNCYIRIEDQNHSKPLCDCNNVNYSNSTVRLVPLNKNLDINDATKILGNLKYDLNDTDGIHALDVNADGKTDLIQFREGKAYVYGLNADNTSLDLLWSTSDSRIKMDFKILPGDYNGDGKADFLIPTAKNSTVFSLFMSTGSGFKVYGNTAYPFMYKEYDVDNYPSTVKGYDLIPIDINGDNRTDIIDFQNTTKQSGFNGTQTIRLYQNIGSSSSTASPYFAHAATGSYFGELEHFPVPIFLSSNSPNGNLDFATMSDNSVTSFEFTKDHRKEVLLQSVNNNGITTNIEYGKVDSKDPENLNSYPNIYEPEGSQVYPFVNVDIAPSFTVVSKLEQTGAGITRTKEFLYRGAVSHVMGLGFLGFSTLKRSNWHGTNVETKWNISAHDPMLRGAVTEEWVSTTYSLGNLLSHTTYNYDYKLIANPGSAARPEYESDITIDNSINGARTDEASNSITLLPGFYANGANGAYIARIVPPEDQPGANGYAGVSKVTLKKKTSEDLLTGITTIQTYTYDDYQNVTKVFTTFPGGSKSINFKYSNNSSANNTSYHIGRITNKTERTVLVGSSMTTEETYTYVGNLVKTMKKRGQGTDWLTETFTYDENGNVLTKQLSGGGANRIEKFEYGSNYGGRFLTKSTDVEGLSTSFTYDAVTGNPNSSINPHGHTTTFTYDGWDRLKSKKNYLKNTTTHVYTPQSGGGMKVVTNYPEGGKEEVTYNAFGWKTRLGTLSLNGQWVYISYVYDVLGRKVKVSEPHTGGASQWSETLFDQYGRVLDQNLFNGSHIGITYNGLSTAVNDGTKTVTTTLDALGNRVKVTDPGGTVNYTYYPNGVLKTAVYDGHEVSVQIDGWGRKTKLTDPTAGTYTFKYDILGQLLEETTPKGKSVYTYSTTGKPLTKKITGDYTNMSLTYHYNGDRLISSITGINSIDSETYKYSYTYDSFKRPHIIKEVNGSASFEKRMSYDGFGRVTIQKYISKSLGSGTSSTVTTKNVYDPSSGLLEEIRDNSSASVLWKIKEINARGLALDIDLGNGINKAITYDSYGYIDKVLDQKNSSTNTIVALNLDYNFNVQRGTLTSRENNKFNWNESFGYDNLDRLKSISGSVSKTMTFDNRGRITKNTDIGDYGYQGNNVYRLKEITPNAKGSAYYEQHPTQQISYNAFKKPVEIIEEGHGRASFRYSPMLFRSHAYYGGTDENMEERRYHKHYSSIIPAEIVMDTQTGSTKIITYVAGDAYSAPIAHIKRTGSGAINEYHYLHRDYLGSIMAITDASGALKEQRQFGAWGKIDKFWSSTGATVFTHNSLLGRGYTGHEHFFELDLIHMNGRMYDANLGRFLSPDNFIQDPFNTQNFNRYGYVLNNPLLYNDKSGEFFFIAVAIGAVIGAITQAIKPGANFGSILGGALIGGVGGMIGAGVGGVVAGSGFFGSTAVSSTMGFWSGAATGFAGGFAGGFVGGAGTAWLNGANFGNGLSMGLKNGLVGGLTGGLVKGVSNGFKALAKGESFWKNKDVVAANVNGASANTLNKGVKPTATVEGVSDELLEFDDELKIWFDPSTNLPKTATFSIMVRRIDWQKTLAGVSRQVSQIGEYMSYAGYTFTLTGVGAGVGVPLSGIGNGLNFAGGIGEAYFTNNSAQGLRSFGFLAADQGANMLLKRMPGIAPASFEILRQNTSLKFMLIEKGVNNYYNN